jgi:hypothetical protein
MRRQIAAVVCAAILGLATSPSSAGAQQKSVKACLEEWRAKKASNRADQVARKVYLTQCRAGGDPAPADAAPGRPPLAAGASMEGQVNSTIKDLMESIIDPSADALWGAVGSVVDQEGVHESFPKTPQEWVDLRRAAVRLIEGSNLLMMPRREAAPAGTKSDVPGVELEPADITALIRKKRKSFDAFAKGLRILGWEALRAADSKNVDLLMDVGGRMQDVCEGCHKAFWYPLEKLPP